MANGDTPTRTVDIDYGPSGSGSAVVTYRMDSRNPWWGRFYNPRGSEIGSSELDVEGPKPGRWAGGEIPSDVWLKAANAAQLWALTNQQPVAGWAIGDRFEIPVSARLAKNNTGIFEVDHVQAKGPKRVDGWIDARKVGRSGKPSKAGYSRTFRTEVMAKHAKRVGKTSTPGKAKKMKASFAGCAETYDAMLKLARSLKPGDPIQLRLKRYVNEADKPGKIIKYEVGEGALMESHGSIDLLLTSVQFRTSGWGGVPPRLAFQPKSKYGSLVTLARSTRGPTIVTGISRGSMVEAKKAPTKKRDYTKEYATIPRNSKLFDAAIMEATHVRPRVWDGMIDGSRDLPTVERPSKAYREGMVEEAHGGERGGTKAGLKYHGPARTWRRETSDYKEHPGLGEYHLRWFQGQSTYFYAPPPDVIEAQLAKPKKPAGAPKKKPAPAWLKAGASIASKANPEWGTWRVRERTPGVPGSWTIQGDSGQRVLSETEASRFWWKAPAATHTPAANEPPQGALSLGPSKKKPSKKAAKKPTRANGATYTIEAKIRGEWSQKKRTGTYKDAAAARLRVERFKTPWRIVEHRDGKRRIAAKSNGNGGKKHVERIAKLKAAKKAGKGSQFLERVLGEEQRRLSAVLRGI